MKRGELQANWNGLSEEILEGMAGWREQHPKATFREIEAEIDKRLSELRAKMIVDTAMVSTQAEWEAGTAEVVCPQCGEKLEKKGKKKRKLATQGGREVELIREYGVCSKCGQGIFPLDEELQLLPGKLAPHEHERLVRLASWIPSFEKAVELFEDLRGIEVGKLMSQRYTEAAGAAYEQMQKEEVEYLERQMPPACGGAQKMQISADGATPHLRWVQVWYPCCMVCGLKYGPW